MRSKTALATRVETGVRKYGEADKENRRKPVDWSDRVLKPLRVQEAAAEATRLLATPDAFVGSRHLELVAAEDPEEAQPAQGSHLPAPFSECGSAGPGRSQPTIRKGLSKQQSNVWGPYNHRRSYR